MTVIGCLRTSFAFSLLLGAITASALDVSVGTLVAEELGPNGRMCRYLDDAVHHDQLLSNGLVATKNSVDYSRLYPKTTRCPKTIELRAGPYRTGKADALLFATGQRIHICAYYLDEDTMQRWHRAHPNARKPLFEDVYPATTHCPDPPDDYTPLDRMTPAQHEEAWRIMRDNDCRSLRDSATDTAESEYRACIASRTPVGASTASYMIQTLPEMTSSRHFVDGVQLSITPVDEHCWAADRNNAWSYRLMVDGHPGDQYFCVGRMSAAIFIGDTFTSEALEPIESWRTTHAGLTYRGVVLDPRAVRPASTPAAGNISSSKIN